MVMMSQGERPLRLIPYIRVSRVGGRSGDSFQSPDQQLEAIQHVAALKGATLLSEIRDLDESGGTMNRPGLKQALKLMDEGRAEGIVVAKLDRFARDPAAIGVIEAMEAKGKLFVSAADAFDTSTSVGKFALGMMVLVAKLERDRNIESWDVSTRNAIRRGVHTTVPYGYRRSGGKGTPLEPREPEASVVRRIYALRCAAVGNSAIADALNAEGILSSRGGAWTPQSIGALVRSRSYRGEARYGEHVQPGAHEALVEPSEWEAAQPDRRGPRRFLGESVLAGLIRCAGCHYCMAGGSGAVGRRYGCNRRHATGTCPAPTTAKAESVERIVIAAFLERYGAARVNGATDNPDLQFARLEADRLQREFVAWRDDTTLRAALGDEEYREGLLSRKRAVDAAKWHYEDLVRENDAAELTIDQAVWADLSIPERRELLRAGIDCVFLRRAASTREPVANRLDIRWIGEAPDDLPVQGGHRALALA